MAQWITCPLCLSEHADPWPGSLDGLDCPRCAGIELGQPLDDLRRALSRLTLSERKKASVGSRILAVRGETVAFQKGKELAYAQALMDVAAQV